MKKPKAPKYNPADVARVKETLQAQIRTYGDGLVRWVWNRLRLETTLRRKYEHQKFIAEKMLKEVEAKFRSAN